MDRAAGSDHLTRLKAWTSGLSNKPLMEAQRLTQSGHCSPGPGHQSQNDCGGAAASSLSLPALSAPAPGLSGLLNNQHYTDR